MEETKKSRALVITAAITICVIAFTYAITRQVLNRKPDPARTLAEMSTQLNKRLPMVVDSETRWDSTTTGPERALIYRYTLVSVEATEIKPEVIATVRARALANYKSNPTMKSLRDLNATLRYQYYNKSGAYVTEFSVSPKDF
ncbi:hypothetical protein AYO41_02830 [Verrucomicrobia bacterium SCGC AG-212-E04]|nr:hypothetical protein AYO41_02830 [Verrucomicrobia bacterium SCGC AG-212-E04]